MRCEPIKKASHEISVLEAQYHEEQFSDDTESANTAEDFYANLDADEDIDIDADLGADNLKTEIDLEKLDAELEAEEPK
jgi:hypothetical protein